MTSDVILREPGDLLRFATIGEAAQYMEPIDVRNGEWTAWDATGRVLDIGVETARRGRGIFSTTFEQVTLCPTETRDPDGLTDAIYAWLVARGIDVPRPASLQQALTSWERLG